LPIHAIQALPTQKWGKICEAQFRLEVFFFKLPCIQALWFFFYLSVIAAQFKLIWPETTTQTIIAVFISMVYREKWSAYFQSTGN